MRTDLENLRPAPWDPARDRAGVAYRIAKRSLDLALATLLLVVLLPLGLAIAAAVRVESPGPAIFRQVRVGARRRVRAGRAYWEPATFTILKFRTMGVDADQSVHIARIRRYVHGEAANGSGPTFKPQDDPRVTRVGRVLRAWSLDELPQLWNVLRGEMSLVGPRPVPAYEAAALAGPQMRRFTTRPGITGLWQVSGRSDLCFDDAVACDLDYVERQSLGLDLRILGRTVLVVLGRKGSA